MTEKQRLLKLIEDHYDGSPWLDVVMQDVLNDINAKTASTKISGLNSIWQLVHHMIHWRKVNMARVNGKIIAAPGHNFIVEINDTSEKAWLKMKSNFDKTQIQLQSFISSFDSRHFDRVYNGNGHTYYEHIQGILQHEAYHLGQIVLLKKMILKNQT